MGFAGMTWLTNPSLSGFDNFVIWVNMALAMAALHWNVVAARVGIAGMRSARAMVAGLAVLYIAAYLVLVISDVQAAQWSSLMRGVSIVVWLVVWTNPARRSIELWGRVPGDAHRTASQRVADIVAQQHGRED